MATLYITQFKSVGILPGREMQAAMVPPLAEQAMSFTVTTASNAFNVDAGLIRLHTDADCYIEFGTAPTATTSNGIKMIAGQTEYFSLKKPVDGLKVAAYDGTS